MNELMLLIYTNDLSVFPQYLLPLNFLKTDVDVDWLMANKLARVSQKRSSGLRRVSVSLFIDRNLKT